MRLISLLILCFTLLSCGQPNPNTLIIGTIAGPETDLVETAQKIAQERYGLTIKIVEFNDYNLPNAALEDGSLDANVYQHLPYLKTAQTAHHYHLEVIGKTFVYPTGIYSSKVRTIQELRPNAVIAIPNDPSNEIRALMLLQKAHLIQFSAHQPISIHAITANPKQLRFKELDAAQLPRVLPDVDAAVLNTTFALPAGLNPAKDAIFLEGKDSPYANLIVIKEQSPKKQQLLQFVKAFQSEEVKQKAQTLFGSAAIAAW